MKNIFFLFFFSITMNYLVILNPRFHDKKSFTTTKHHKDDSKDSLNSCINGSRVRELDISWEDSTKSKLVVNITYENKDSLPEIIWIGSWLLALMEGDVKDDFMYGSGLHNKIYLTKKGQNVDFEFCDTCYMCYNHKYTSVDPSFPNYHILWPKQCFKVSFLIKDKRIINFVKENQLRVFFISQEYYRLSLNQIESLVKKGNSENNNWYDSSHLMLDFGSVFYDCLHYKTYYSIQRFFQPNDPEITPKDILESSSMTFTYLESYPNL